MSDNAPETSGQADEAVQSQRGNPGLGHEGESVEDRLHAAEDTINNDTDEKIGDYPVGGNYNQHNKPA